VWALPVHRGTILLTGEEVQRLRGVERVSVVWRESVGEEDSLVNGVGLRRVDCVGRKDNQDEDEWIYPGVFEGDLLPFS
jgi:hypothetical protein